VNKKKILFVINTFQMGGAEKALVNLLNNINLSNYEVSVAILLGGGSLLKEVKNEIETIFLIRTKSRIIKKIKFFILFNILPLKVVYKILIKKPFDIEIAFAEGLPTKLIQHSTNQSSKKIAFVHTDLMNNYLLSDLYSSVEACFKAYSALNIVAFVSHQAKIGFDKKIGKLSNSRVVYNIIDDKKIIDLAKENIEEKKNYDLLFISVGRLDPVKGFGRLLEVVFQLTKEGYLFELWIIGDGKEYGKLKNFLIEHELNNVKLLGLKENPYPYIKKSDVFICSSYAEGLSTTISEALILNKAVLTTDCAGMGEILGDGAYGMIVENSEVGIYEGMKMFLKDSSLIKNYAALSTVGARKILLSERIKAYETLFS
jgi:glycosyltransferase involved in cell wall biosynthesis